MPMQKLSRRDFIKVTGIAVGATALACSGAGYLATHKPDIPTPELTYREETTMNHHVLITYATRAGSTAEIAAAIGENLGQRGFAVDVKPIKERPQIVDYETVLVGSAIRMGKWLPEAVEFVETHQESLNTRAVALFTVHMNNVGDDDESRTARHAYLDAVRPLLKDTEEIYFEGKMDFSRLSFLDRMIAKAVGATEADNRDWDRIRGWVPESLNTER